MNFGIILCIGLVTGSSINVELETRRIQNEIQQEALEHAVDMAMIHRLTTTGISRRCADGLLHQVSSGLAESVNLMLPLLTFYLSKAKIPETFRTHLNELTSLHSELAGYVRTMLSSPGYGDRLAIYMTIAPLLARYSITFEAVKQLDRSQMHLSPLEKLLRFNWIIQRQDRLLEMYRKEMQLVQEYLRGDRAWV